MTNNKELEAGLKAMAEDFQLPAGGRKKLSQLVAEHLECFNAAERRGMSWRNMIRALTAAGVTGRGGRSLSVGTLSSIVWRKRTKTEDPVSCAGQQSRLAPSMPAHPHPRTPQEVKRLPTEHPSRGKRTASRSFDDQAQAKQQSPTSSKRSAPKVSDQNKGNDNH